MVTQNDETCASADTELLKEERDETAFASDAVAADIDCSATEPLAAETPAIETPDEKTPAAAETKLTRKQQFFQLLKFTAFSLSAGIIQLLSTTALHQWTGWLKDYYYIAYVIGLTLSVIWNFTFNRKFTFKAANNVPLAMGLVILYNCIIVVPMALGGDALVNIWGDDLGIVVTIITLLINFVTEFFWDKFVVFNGRVTARLENLFRRNKA